MEWGRRLYQNKDGSLTPLGRLHYGVGKPRKSGGGKTSSKGVHKMGNRKDSIKAIKARKEEAASKERVKKALAGKLKNLSELSDDELKAVTTRLNMESNYRALLEKANPTKEHAIRKFVGESLKKIGTAVIDKKIADYKSTNNGQGKGNNGQNGSPSPKVLKDFDKLSAQERSRLTTADWEAYSKMYENREKVDRISRGLAEGQRARDEAARAARRARAEAAQAARREKAEARRARRNARRARAEERRRVRRTRSSEGN